MDTRRESGAKRKEVGRPGRGGRARGGGELCAVSPSSAQSLTSVGFLASRHICAAS